MTAYSINLRRDGLSNIHCSPSTIDVRAKARPLMARTTSATSPAGGGDAGSLILIAIVVVITPGLAVLQYEPQ